MNYRRCETSVTKMLSMINLEMEQIENIQKELNAGAINLDDIDNRYLGNKHHHFQLLLAQ